MKNSVKLIFYFFIVILSLQSCSIEKRHYMLGYSVKKNMGRAEVAPEKMVFKPQSDIVFDRSGNENLLASTDENKIYLQGNKFTNDVISESEKTLNTSINLADNCDKITFKSGKEESVLISQIKKSTIVYKRCDNADGPDFIVEKADLESIQYSHTKKKDIIIAKKNRWEGGVIEYKTKMERRIHKRAVWGLVFSILSFIPFYGIPLGVLSIIFCSWVLRKSKKFSEMNEERIFAKIGIIVAPVGLAVSIIVTGYLIIDALAGLHII